ncbi:MAG: recombinase family protein, partial [Planctomycetales bacterium]
MQALSIDGQRTACETYAATSGLLIVDTFVEHQSAKAPGRPVYAAMLKRIEAGEADGILSYHPNRLARNSKDGGDLIYWLDTGVIKDLRFPVFWFANDPQGKSVLGIEFAQSKRYSDDLSIVTKRGISQKCLRGEYPGPTPRGYLNDRRTKTIKIDREFGPVVAEAFERFANGTETIASLQQFLASKGMTTESRNPSRRGGPISKDTVRLMLTNPIYYGAFRYAGVVYDGKHEPVLSKQLFDKVQKVMDVRAPTVRTKETPKPFTRLIRCAKCGMSITSETQKGIVYYRCSRQSRVVVCTTPYIRSEDLVMALSTTLDRYGIPDSVAAQLLEYTEARFTAGVANLESTRDSIRQRQQVVATKLGLLTDTLLDGAIDRVIYVQKQNELQSERATLKAKLLEIEQGHFGWLEPVRKWIKTAQRVHEITSSGTSEELRTLAVEIFGSNL